MGMESDKTMQYAIQKRVAHSHLFLWAGQPDTISEYDGHILPAQELWQSENGPSQWTRHQKENRAHCGNLQSHWPGVGQPKLSQGNNIDMREKEAASTVL